jgi:hypothetical protein
LESSNACARDIIWLITYTCHDTFVLTLQNNVSHEREIIVEYLERVLVQPESRLAKGLLSINVRILRVVSTLIVEWMFEVWKRCVAIMTISKTNFVKRRIWIYCNQQIHTFIQSYANCTIMVKRFIFKHNILNYIL